MIIYRVGIEQLEIIRFDWVGNYWVGSYRVELIWMGIDLDGNRFGFEFIGWKLRLGRNVSIPEKNIKRDTIEKTES